MTLPLKNDQYNQYIRTNHIALNPIHSRPKLSSLAEFCWLKRKIPNTPTKSGPMYPIRDQSMILLIRLPKSAEMN